MAHHPHPLDNYDAHRIMLSVIDFFSQHYHERFTIPQLSQQLGISLLHIETAFDNLKGKTASQALLEYRLNRLCDRMGSHPSAEIGILILQCGLPSFNRTNDHFIACFGIDLIEYHQQCFLSEAARLRPRPIRVSNPGDVCVGSPLRQNLLLTRFHQSA